MTSAGVVAAWWFGQQAYANEESAPYAYEELAQTTSTTEAGDTAGITDDDLPEASAAAASGGDSGAPYRGTSSGGGSSGGGAKPAKGAAASSSSSSSGAGVVRASLNRALGPSFGSICLGSLLVAGLSTVETVVRFCRDSCGESAGEGDPEAGAFLTCFGMFCFIMSLLLMLFVHVWL